MSSIFVQISAYEEPEISKTIYNLLNTSSKNHTINIGLHTCFKNKTDMFIPDLPNIKHIHSEAPDNIGVCRGRRLADSFYDGEDYYLQIDAHSRFNEYWDEFLLSEIHRFKSLGIQKPFITGYPNLYWYEDDIEILSPVDYVHSMTFNNDKNLFKEKRYPLQTQIINDNNTIFSLSVSAASIFHEGPGIIPSDDIFFLGEEISIAAMAFTRGFDLVIPQKPYMYHLYYDKKIPEKYLRNLVWQDWPEEYQKYVSISDKTVFDMFTKNIIGPQHLGTTRTLKEFQDFTGLGFITGEIADPC
jgi:hypothetical protein